jgi:hypothetical protein
MRGKFFCTTFFVALNFTKLKITKFLSKLTKNLSILTQKIVTKLLETWVFDPGSEITKKTPDQGVEKSTGSRILDPQPLECLSWCT